MVLAIGHARGGRVTKGNMAVPCIEGLREPLKLNTQVLDQLVDDFINDVPDDPRISETGSKEYLVHYTNTDLVPTYLPESELPAAWTAKYNPPQDMLRDLAEGEGHIKFDWIKQEWTGGFSN